LEQDLLSDLSRGNEISGFITANSLTINSRKTLYSGMRYNKGPMNSFKFHNSNWKHDCQNGDGQVENNTIKENAANGPCPRDLEVLEHWGAFKGG